MASLIPSDEMQCYQRRNVPTLIRIEYRKHLIMKLDVQKTYDLPSFPPPQQEQEAHCHLYAYNADDPTDQLINVPQETLRKKDVLCNSGC